MRGEFGWNEWGLGLGLEDVIEIYTIGIGIGSGFGCDDAAMVDAFDDTCVLFFHFYSSSPSSAYSRSSYARFENKINLFMARLVTAYSTATLHVSRVAA